MSLTSYRAAPPRGELSVPWARPRDRFQSSAISQSSVPRARPGELTTETCWLLSWTGRPGGDLLSRALRHSTMGAGGFHGRVREGIGCGPPAKATRSSGPCSSFPFPGTSPGTCFRRQFPGPGPICQARGHVSEKGSGVCERYAADRDPSAVVGRLPDRTTDA
jgi:hypothetical protein